MHLIESAHHIGLAAGNLCIDELRFSMWAANCLYPGISSLIINMLHTAEPKPVNDVRAYSSALTFVMILLVEMA